MGAIPINSTRNIRVITSILNFMRRRFRRPRKEKVIEPRFRANERILAPSVSVIDEAGKSLGEITLQNALDIARERGYDLVEVAPNVQPPVCKLLDYGKFQYQQSKQEQQAKAKQRKIAIKGVRIGLRTDDHDMTFKKQQVEKFLNKGHKVKIEVFLRGREKAYRDRGREALGQFIQLIGIPYKIEEEIKGSPSGFSIIITAQ